MFKYIARKAGAGVVLVLIGTVIAYFVLVTNGRGIVQQLIGENATPATIAQRQHELGLDRPFWQQYGDWVVHLFQGDLGRSYYTGEPVTDLLALRVPVTLSVVLSAVVLLLVLSIAVGSAAAVKGGAVDSGLQVLGVLGSALPSFIVGIVLIAVFAISVRIFPATGYVAFTDNPGQWALSLVLPVTAVLIGTVAAAAQQFRGAMIDSLNQDFVRTLRARGVPEGMVVFRHALRNAAIPGLTTISLQTIGLIGGVVVIERVFALPGIAAQLSSSALQRDVPVVMGATLFTIIVVVVVNLALDLVSAWINPKVRLS